ncbi:MAG: nuclear transport factor 2 family protein [Chitinophagaceae bacterium]
MQYRKLLTALLLSTIISCSTTSHNISGVEKAMHTYNEKIKSMDVEAISLIFTPDGHLGEMATGRDSIKAFLSSFKNVQVLTQNSTTDSIKIIKDTAIQTGTYMQSDIINRKDTLHVSGTFTARWEWVKGSGWLLEKMNTEAK